MNTKGIYKILVNGRYAVKRNWKLIVNEFIRGSLYLNGSNVPYATIGTVNVVPLRLSKNDSHINVSGLLGRSQTGVARVFPP